MAPAWLEWKPATKQPFMDSIEDFKTNQRTPQGAYYFYFFNEEFTAAVMLEPNCLIYHYEEIGDDLIKFTSLIVPHKYSLCQ